MAKIKIVDQESHKLRPTAEHMCCGSMLRFCGGGSAFLQPRNKCAFEYTAIVGPGLYE